VGYKEWIICQPIALSKQKMASLFKKGSKFFCVDFLLRSLKIAVLEKVEHATPAKKYSDWASNYSSNIKYLHSEALGWKNN